MPKSQSLELVIRAKDAASKELKKVDKALGIMQNSVGRVSKAVFSLKTAFAGLGAAYVAKGFLDTASSFEKYEVALTTIVGSAGKAAKAMDWIADFTSTTPYELDQVTESFVKLSAYGFDATKHLGMLGDTAASMGKDLNQAVEAFADAATGEFERLKEFGIKARTEGDNVTFSWVENGRQMEKAVQKTQDAITEGLSEIWSDRFAGGMARFQSTWAGMWSNLKDQFTLFQKAVMEAGVFEYLKTGLNFLLSKINELKKSGELDEWAKETGEAIVTAITKTLTAVSYVPSAFFSVMEAAKKVTTFLVAMADAGLGVAQAFLTINRFNPQFLIAMRAVGTSVKEITTNIKDMRAKLGDIGTGLLISADESSEAAQSWAVMGLRIRESVDETYNKVKAAMRKTKEEIVLPGDDAAGKPKTALISQSALNLLSKAEKDLMSLEIIYQQGEVELADYLERRKTLVLSVLKEEITALEKAASAETDTAKQLQLADDIWMKKNEYALKEIELQKEIATAYKESAERKAEAEKMFYDLRLRTSEEMQSEYATELAELDARHAEELEKFKELLDDKLAAEMEYVNEAAALHAIEVQQAIEKERLIADQNSRTWEQKLENAQQVAQGLSDIFQNLYELSGEKNKAMFYAAKAAAIAEAIINVQLGMTKALGQGGIMGPVMAAIVGAAGAVQIATIMAQELAAGGMVRGHSPSDTADNIPIAATAGEFVQPVATVRHYGAQAMEAIRQRIVPRDFLLGAVSRTLPVHRPSYAFAAGGMVSGPSTSQGEMKSETTIINVTDPRDLDQYFASAAGQNAILNVLSSRAQRVRKILS